MELQTPVIVKEVADEKRGDERRKEATVYTQRKFIRRGREFIFPLTVYLSDTNAFGNVYFAQYFVWQGKTREDWFRWVMGQDAAPFMQRYKMATVEASHKYRNECLAFQEVEIGLFVKVTRMCLEVTFHFRFKGTSKTVGIGKQRIAFIDSTLNKLVPVPEDFKEKIKRFGMLP